MQVRDQVRPGHPASGTIRRGSRPPVAPGAAATQVALIQRKAGNRAATALAAVARRQDDRTSTGAYAGSGASAAPEAAATGPGPGDPGASPVVGQSVASDEVGTPVNGPSADGAPGMTPEPVGGGPPPPTGPAGAAVVVEADGAGGGHGPATGPAGVEQVAEDESADRAEPEPPAAGRPAGRRYEGGAGAGGSPGGGAGPGGAVRSGGGPGGGGARGGGGLAAFKARAGSAATKLRRRAPTGAHVGAMQAAAVGPANEQMAGAKAAQVGDMATAPAGVFDRAGFIAAVEQAIAKHAPKNLEEADNLSSSGAMDQVKGAVAERVGDSHEAAADPVADATEAPPQPDRGTAKPVEPMSAPDAVDEPAPLGAAAVMPAPQPAAATDLQAPGAEVNAEMAEEGVTERQLAESEEPEFVDALEAKKEGDRHSREAPGPVRAEEQGILGQARGAASSVEQAGITALIGRRRAADQAVHGAKAASKGRDESQRKQVADRIEQIYSRTQAEAKRILNGLGPKVNAAFTAGEGAARAQFEAQHKAEFQAWKDKRYDGVFGKGRWVADKLTGVPAEANAIFERARTTYLGRMRGVIASVADIVAGELQAAKARIAAGRAEIGDYVASLPRGLRGVGRDLAADVQQRFDALDADVVAKQGEMVQAVAGKYNEAKGAVDAKVDELKAANQGLWGAAKAKIMGVINTIRQLKAAIESALAGAAGAVALIIANPKRFLSNLFAAIGDGFTRFKANIAGHLQQGFFSWLTGMAGQAGISLPASFDLKGIIGLILEVMGLTWANLRARIVSKLGPRGEAVMARIESGVAFVRALITEGPVALWKLIAGRITNLWDLVVGKLKEFLITRVIMAGVTWILGLLNPVAGFIKVVKAIVNIVQWLWSNAGRIAELVKTIAGSATAIARGSVGAAAAAVEGVLARLLPLAIGFLASLLGVDGIPAKVRSVIGAVRGKVNGVIDKALNKVVAFGRRLLNSRIGQSITGAAKRGIAYGKKKIAQAKAWGERKVQAVKKRVYGGDDSPEGKQKRLRFAVDEGVRAVNLQAARRSVPAVLLLPYVELVRRRRGVEHLDLIPKDGKWMLRGSVDRMVKETEAGVPGSEIKSDSDTPGIVDLSSIAKLVSRQRQLRHIKDSEMWIRRGRGGYFLDQSDAQSILDALHNGSAQILGKTRQGHILVRFGGVVGFNNNPAKGYLDQPTDKFLVKGQSSVSLVPTSPDADLSDE